jgi:alanine-synthesizing transaminase
MFSNRCVKESDASPFAARFQQAALSPGFLDLTGSNPTLAGLDYDTSGLKRALGEADWTSYAPEPLGLASARAEVAERLPPLALY